MSTLGPNLIRTYVPILAGLVISWLVAHGVHVDAATSAWLVTVMTSVITAGYYTVVRVVEERYPAAGLLLGARNPARTTPEPADPQTEEHADWLSSLRDDLHLPPRPPAPPAAADTTAAPGAHQYAPAPPLATTRTGGLADLGETRPDVPVRPRKADTGAIPVYKPPPGR